MRLDLKYISLGRTRAEAILLEGSGRHDDRPYPRHQISVDGRKVYI